MARPQKKRNVCCAPRIQSFEPDYHTTEKIELTVDEYEAIRLIDYEKLTQEECALQMQVSRTTVQGIYNVARSKIADALVNGIGLVIRGGDYRICDSDNGECNGYCKHYCLKRRQEKIIFKKENNIMRIAVTYEDGEIFQHFGHTSQFKVYDIEDKKVVSSQVIDTNGSGHGALAGFLAANQVDILICGGIGGGAQTALSDAGIRLYGGVAGSADAAVDALLADSLEYNAQVRCNHHDHEHGEGHTCSDHGCH